MITPRRILVAIIISFGISVVMATATTIRQVHIAAASGSQPKPVVQLREA